MKSSITYHCLGSNSFVQEVHISQSLSLLGARTSVSCCHPVHSSLDDLFRSDDAIFKIGGWDK
jgi:hypothetical protein